MNDHPIKWSDIQTFLAPNIKQLYDNYSSCAEHCQNIKKTHNESRDAQAFICKWNLNSLNLHGLPEDCLSEEWFSLGLKRILPLVREVSLLLTPSGLNQLSLQWTGMYSVLQRALGQITESSIVHHFIGILQISAVTERVLGQIFLLKGQKVPFLLRDLLNTDELKELLGKELVDFFRILMGSVLGLNIRNIAWHGFLGIQDIHREHAALILFALHRCEERLRKQNLEISSPSCLDREEVFSSLNGNMKKFEAEEDDSMEIVSNSPFVHTVMHPLWEVVVNLISHRENSALLLILPLIENALRILYAHVNSRPLSTILTATNSAFYVTMDEILHPWVTTSIDQKPGRIRVMGESTTDSESPGQNPNLVPLYLGRQLTEAFYDLFHHTAGPRLRDRVSHGELACDDVSFETVRHLFCLSLLALSVPRWRFLNTEQQRLFSIKCGCTKDSSMTMSHHECSFHYSNDCEDHLREFHANSPCLGPRNSQLISYISDYEGKFHPSSLLKQTLLEVVSVLKHWKLWPRPHSPDFLPESSWNDSDCTQDVGSEWRLPFARYSFKRCGQISEISSSLLNTSFATIFFSKMELEIIRILQQIANNVYKSVENIHSSLASRQAAYSSKRLRSRQRESYVKQVTSIPSIVCHLLVIVQMLLFVYSVSDRWRSVHASLSCPLKAVLKKVLKTTENLVTFTDSFVNKYHEALEILRESTKRVNFCFIDYFPSEET